MRKALVLGAALASLAWAVVLAEPATNQTGGESGGGGATQGPPPGPPGVPVIQVPKEPESPVPPPTNTVAKHAAAASNAAATNGMAPGKPTPIKQLPPAPVVKPVHAPTAILQALDKITTETMRFAVPVNQPVRFKNLVFTVKSCETTGAGGAAPQSSAYVIIDSAPKGAPGASPPPARRVFKGWMYAQTPELDPFQHPIYDAWLITCAAALPAS